jgi:hypothetical protein
MLFIPYFIGNRSLMKTNQDTKQALEEQLPELQYLVAGDICSAPTNCCAECLWFYCLADCCGCVKGLMLQQLINKDETDPMSQKYGGCMAKFYCLPGCYDLFFPCVVTDGWCKFQSNGIGGASETEQTFNKYIRNEFKKDIECALIKEVAPIYNIRLQLHGNMCCAPLHKAAYVITKNKQNKKKIKNQVSSPFYAEFHHPPGTKEIEFLIP